MWPGFPALLDRQARILETVAKRGCQAVVHHGEVLLRNYDQQETGALQCAAFDVWVGFGLDAQAK
jgi:hypothetical protein